MSLTQLSRRRSPSHLGAAIRRGSSCYRVRRKAVLLGTDFWIEDQDGRHVYRIEGTELGTRSFMDLENAHGDLQCRISSPALPMWCTTYVGPPSGEPMAVVQRAAGSSGDEPWRVQLTGGHRLTVVGSVPEHEFTLERGRQRLAVMSKRWFRSQDEYGVLTVPGEDPVLALAVSIALDAAARPGAVLATVTPRG